MMSVIYCQMVQQNKKLNMLKKKKKANETMLTTGESDKEHMNVHFFKLYNRF